MALAATFLLLATLLTAQERDIIRYSDMPTRPGVVPTITTPVTAQYGTYMPYRTPKYKATIGLSEPSIRPDFSNIITPAGGFSWEKWFSGAERGSLRRDRVALRSELMGSFGQAYNGMQDMPDFLPLITTDAVVNGLRIATEEAYRQAERNQLAPDLRSVLNSLATQLGVSAASESDAGIKEAIYRLLAYVETGRLLLDPSATVHPSVSEAARTEVEKIQTGTTAASSVFPDRNINYGELTPSGYNKVNDALGQYTLAKNWLSKVELRIDRSVVESRMGALLARAVDMLDDRERDRLRQITDIESFFSGYNETQLTPEEMAGTMRAWYGFQYDGGSSYLEEDQAVERLIAYVRRANAGRTMTLALLPEEKSTSEGIFALMQKKLSAGSNPYGVALLSAMRSDEAPTEIGMKELRSQVSSIPAEEWVKNLDLLSLYTASIIVGEDRPSGFPEFMRSQTWKQRLNVSALASWGAFTTERGSLQGNISSATQTIAKSKTESHSNVGYVEPDPEAWSAIATQARYIRQGLTSGQRGRLIDTGLEEKLSDIENVAAHVMRIAAFELQGMALTTEQRELVASTPDRIAAWETYIDKSLQHGVGLTASSSLNGKLGPALGHPVALYVLYPTSEGDVVLTRGAVFSYHETSAKTDSWVSQITQAGTLGSVPVSAIKVVERSLNSVTPSLQKSTERGTTATTYIELESNIVRRASGGVWYTIHAPRLNGADVITTVVDAAGRSVFQSFQLPIENGERYDLVPTEDLQTGHYFIRVSTVTGEVLASGRFMIVQ